MSLKRHIRALLQRAGYRIEALRPPEPYPYLDVLELLVERQVALGERPYVVQIGANDGTTMDPLHRLLERHALPGLMVEPQPAAFARLRANRGHLPGLSFEQALIGTEDGHATLYVLRPDTNLPEWLGQAASMDRNQLFCVLDAHLRSVGQPRPAAALQAMIEPVRLPSLTMRSLLARHGVTRVDLLVLDTMGHDHALLRSFPFDLVEPAIIQFEHRLITRPEHEDCIRLLGGRGYSLCNVDMDTVAVRGAPTRQGHYTVS